MNLEGDEDANAVVVLRRKVTELEETIRWILRRIRMTKKDLEGDVPQFVRDCLENEVGIGVEDGASGTSGGCRTKRSTLPRRNLRRKQEEIPSKTRDYPIKQEVPPFSPQDNDTGGHDYFQDNQVEQKAVTDNQESIVNKEKEVPKNPHVLLEKLSSKDLQKYSKVNLDPPKTSKWQCKVCPSTFPGVYALQWHKYKENHYTSSKPSYHSLRKCSICSATFPTIAVLNCHRRKSGHFKKKLNIVTPKCHICGDTFPTKKALLPHRKMEHSKIKTDDDGGKVQFQCQICRVTFSQKNDLRKHKRKQNHYSFQRSTEACRPCKICGQMFPTFHALECHRNQLHPKTPSDLETESQVNCQVCGIPFPSKNQLQTHKIKENHFLRKNEGKKTCEFCGKVTGGGRRYREHVATHTKEKLALCPICGKSLGRKDYLKQHLEAFHGNQERERAFQCKYCGKDFLSKANLTKHERVQHENLEKQPCPLCGLSVRNLSKHVRGVHQKLRNYPCNLCEKSFKQSSHLKRHLASHGNPNGRKKGYHVERVDKIRNLGKEEEGIGGDFQQEDEEDVKVNRRQKSRKLTEKKKEMGFVEFDCEIGEDGKKFVKNL